MKNIVPMTMILLMFACVFANTSWIELNENEMGEAADGRADDDVGLLGILEPRATKTDTMTGEMRNTIKSGESVNIVVAVQNHGSNAVTEMNIIATIYMSDGTVAKDSSGNDLVWTDAVICDDPAACPIQTLESGQYLNGGSYSIRDSTGAPITWVAPLGAYQIGVELDATGDEDLTNDEAVNDVSVVNWYDLDVDIEWDSGAKQAEGAGPHAFTVTVSTDGSESWSARNVTIDLEVSGAAVEAAADADGNDIMGTTTHYAGTAKTVETFFNESAPCTDPGADGQYGTSDDGPCDPRNGNGSRLVIDFQDSWTFSGSITPDGNANGGYSVAAVLKEYVLYGAAADCEEVGEEQIDENDPNITAERTWRNMCEVIVQTDDNSSNNDDRIDGYIGSYHNIGISTIVVAQGYDSAGGGVATSMKGDQDSIDVGFSRLHVTVEHRGSTGTGPYDWEVVFTITDEWDNDAVVATYTANQCPEGVEPAYTYGALGEEPPAGLTGFACVSHSFTDGKFKVEATISMIGSSNPDESSVDDSISAIVEARNHNPSVSLSSSSENLVVGDMVTLDAAAFDAEDLTGESLIFNWSRINVASQRVPISECNPLADDPDTPEDDSTKGERVCMAPVDDSWATTLPVTVEVTDPHGGVAADTLHVTVWNSKISTVTVGNVSVSYALTYMAPSEFSISATAGDAITGQVLGESSEASDSVHVLNYEPSTTYDATNVLTQTLTVAFPGSTSEDYSLWWKYEGQNWQLLDNEAAQGSTSDMMELSWVNTDSGVLSGGTLAIFNRAAEDSVPANGVKNAFGTNMAGGQIAVQWTLDNDGVDLTSSDQVEVCYGADDCIKLANDATQYIITGAHGDVFTITVSVVNGAGANANVKSFNATADAEVSPAPSVVFGTTTNGSAAWTLNLDTTDAGDASKLHICWKDSVIGSMELPGDLSCEVIDASDSSVDVTKPSVGTDTVYHFAIYAEDSAGNVLKLSADKTETAYGTEQDPTGGGDKIGDDVAASEGVPTWAWGVIIGIVVVAFGIGAFILSRGGEGGEKEWDY